jgi:hypothetical protein
VPSQPLHAHLFYTFTINAASLLSYPNTMDIAPSSSSLNSVDVSRPFDNTRKRPASEEAMSSPKEKPDHPPEDDGWIPEKFRAVAGPTQQEIDNV